MYTRAHVMHEEIDNSIVAFTSLYYTYNRILCVYRNKYKSAVERRCWLMGQLGLRVFHCFSPPPISSPIFSTNNYISSAFVRRGCDPPFAVALEF